MAAAPFKLTVPEALALIASIQEHLGYAGTVAALVEAIGVEKATKLIRRQSGVKLTKADNLAIIKAVYQRFPGDTARDKIKLALKEAREAFPKAARFKEALAYVMAKVDEFLEEGIPTDVSSSYPVVGQGTITGYGPVNNHWKIPDTTVVAILDQMQRCNVRAYKVESVGHASEDVLGKPALAEQMRRATLFAKSECKKRGIYYHVTLFNDNAGKNTWKNHGPSLADRLDRAKAFIDWFAANVDPAGTYVVIVGETRTSAGKALETYGAKVLKKAGFQIGNNNGSRPQNVTSFGGVQTDFHEYHPTKTSDWPASKRAHVTSDTGAILAQLNVANNVYGLGNPAAIAAWRAEGERKGYDFVIYYGFDVAEYDGPAIEAMSASAHAAPAVPVSDSSEDVDLSKAKWLGRVNGANARVTQDIAPLTFDGKFFHYRQSPGTKNWTPRFTDNGKDLNSCACFFVKRNGVWTGGRFDDCSETRNSRERKNIDGNYLGIRPVDGEEVRFCLVTKDGRERTKAPGVVWK